MQVVEIVQENRRNYTVNHSVNKKGMIVIPFFLPQSQQQWIIFLTARIPF